LLLSLSPFIGTLVAILWLIMEELFINNFGAIVKALT
jgi:hypothetical protein